MAIVSLHPPSPSEAPAAPAPANAHRELCQLAARWLRRPNSAGGPGCQVALTEGWAGWGGEIPDAIGFRDGGHLDGSVIEVKTSRADFLADRRKPHRMDPALGLGRWRYYLCPADLIQPEELPPRWGLLWASGRGVITAKAGPAVALRRAGGGFSQTDYAAAMQAHAFDVRASDREIAILVRTFARLEDPEQMNQRLREANAHAARLARQIATLRGQLSRARAPLQDADPQLPHAP